MQQEEIMDCFSEVQQAESRIAKYGREVTLQRELSDHDDRRAAELGAWIELDLLIRSTCQ